MSSAKCDASTKKLFFALFLIIAIMMVCSYIGGKTITSQGTVEVRVVNFITDDGANLNGRLYIPKDIPTGTKLPVVISCHGWNNTNEVQTINAVELSKRGYIVFALDAYGHGRSTFPVAGRTTDDLADGIIGNGVSLGIEGTAVVADMGVYAALQYVKSLPFADLDNVGMVGHSMGGGTIQSAAYRAFENQKLDSSIVVPKAVLPTAQSFTTSADFTSYLLQDYDVNLGAVYARWDEWASAMWVVDKGLDANTSPKASITFGFDAKANPIEYGKYYTYGNPNPISREEAITAAKSGDLRVMYQPQSTHPGTHFNSVAVAGVVDFFDLSLKDGKVAIPLEEQTWLTRDITGFISLFGFFALMLPLTALLVKTPYFASLVRKPYEGIQLSDTASKKQYALWYFLGLLPAAIIFYPLMGYPIAIKASDRFVATPLDVGSYFQMPIMNGLVLFNIAAGVIALILFVVAYKVTKQNVPSALEKWGVKTNLCQIFKAFLLSIIVFAIGYLTLMFSEFFFGVDFRFFTLSILTLTPYKWLLFIKYLPFFIFFYAINSFTLNISTSIAGVSEWKNYLLCAITNVGGIAIILGLDYFFLFNSGVKLFLTTPFPTTVTSALAGVLGWGLLFILPVAAVMARYIYNRTGNIWIGGFINSLAVTMFAISNTAIGIGMASF